ncbi:MAG: 50S ribosomal protein L18 [Christensenellales bacterium]|jgi:large subunit ribosomal protein L18|nr:50S ribosomal protein L18 [Christensenellaceae bacterium]
MFKKRDKNAQRRIRHARIRRKISGTPEVPRLCVFRSNNYIYAQVIDDTKGSTIAQASSMEQALKEKAEGKTKVETSKLVGKTIAERAMEAGVTSVVFDRGGYVYKGRVASLADGAREAGLKF